MMDYQVLKDSVYSSPAFVLDEPELIKTLATLAELRAQCGCKVLYSLKALPFSTIIEMATAFVDGFSVSSLFEARLADEMIRQSGAEQGCIHLTTPGIRPDELDELSSLCSHISFNSLSQYQRYAETAEAQTSIGLRVNPKLSFVDDDRFDPCRSHSKLGIDIDELSRSVRLDSIQGLHVHNVFSATDFTPLIKTIDKLERHLGTVGLAELEWLNIGGGYLFGQIDDYRPFVERVTRLTHDYGIEVYIEPGKALVGRAGYLVATVLDSFVSDGETVVILDTSINHNPEVFEYQRQPELHEHDPAGRYSAILAGCTCLAGDVFGAYRFKQPLSIGDKVVFNNVGAYTLIKANRFNGYNLPDIYLSNALRLKKLKHYDYQDYRRQWLAD